MKNEVIINPDTIVYTTHKMSLEARQRYSTLQFDSINDEHYVLICLHEAENSWRKEQCHTIFGFHYSIEDSNDFVYPSDQRVITIYLSNMYYRKYRSKAKSDIKFMKLMNNMYKTQRLITYDSRNIICISGDVAAVLDILRDTFYKRLDVDESLISCVLLYKTDNGDDETEVMTEGIICYKELY